MTAQAAVNRLREAADEMKQARSEISAAAQHNSTTSREERYRCRPALLRVVDGRHWALLRAYDDFVSVHPRLRISSGTKRRNEWRRGWSPIVSSVPAYESKVRYETASDLRNATQMDIDRALESGVSYLRTPKNERPHRTYRKGSEGCFTMLLCPIGGLIGARLGLMTGTGIGGFVGMVIGVFVIVGVISAFENRQESRYIPIKDFKEETQDERAG